MANLNGIVVLQEDICRDGLAIHDCSTRFGQSTDVHLEREGERSRAGSFGTGLRTGRRAMIILEQILDCL